MRRDLLEKDPTRAIDWADGFVLLDSGDRTLAPLMIPDEDSLIADKRLVMGAVYHPDLLN